MSTDRDVTVQIGPGFPALLFLVFLTLKLCGTIDWSWWWVTAPLWGPVALLLCLAALAGLAWVLFACLPRRSR